MSRPRMKTIDPKSWKPTVLTAPDGREYTPGSYSEHRQLLASGYAVKKAPAPAAPADPDPPAAPEISPAPAAEIDTPTSKRTPKPAGGK